jgi:precorrin-2 dehydrogenase/sirohydrochlorin ferrochelatase
MSNDPSFSYPVILDLSGKPCLVVGGGAVAQRKVEGLLKVGARVTVVAPELTGSIADLQKDGSITLHRRSFKPDDLDNQTLVFGALDDPEARRNLSAEARKRGVPANLADDPQNCDFIVPSSFSRGDLLVTVSTGGRSPAMSRKLRQVLETKIGQSFAMQVEAMAKVRERVMRDLPDHAELRREVLLDIVDSDLLDVFRNGDEDSFWLRVDRMIIRAVEKIKINE